MSVTTRSRLQAVLGWFIVALMVIALVTACRAGEGPCEGPNCQPCSGPDCPPPAPHVASCDAPPLRQGPASGDFLFQVDSTRSSLTLNPRDTVVAFRISGFVGRNQLFGLIPVAGAKLDATIRSGTVFLTDSSVVTDSAGQAMIQGVFRGRSAVLDLSAIVGRVEAVGSPKVFCAAVVFPDTTP